MLFNDKLELLKLAFRGKRVAILGIGRSNGPAIKLLKKVGAIVSVRDKSKNALDGHDDILKLDVEIILGENYLANLDRFDYILRSPGIKPFLPEIEAAVSKGVKLTSEIELLLEFCPCKVIGVTGSDGKTTTTTLVSQFLKQEGYKVWLGGNIGKSVFAELPNMKKKDIVVLELSSFQLMTLSKSPNISIVTNISPNHLDYHRSFEEYANSKANIFLHQTKSDIFVLNEDDEYTKIYEEMLSKNKIQNEIRKFSINNVLESGVYFSDENIVYNNGKEIVKICSKDEVKLIGMHNIANICAAAAALIDMVSIESIRKVVTTFGGVEHRMELVRNINGVNFYNDSIASSPTRTIAGLVSFKDKVILIAGGYDKNIPYDVIGGYILDKVKLLILVGATSSKIKEAVLNEADKRGLKTEEMLDIKEFDDLEQCVKFANENATKGDNVVMSPASASFDMYKNFEERGNYFKELVNKL